METPSENNSNAQNGNLDSREAPTGSYLSFGDLARRWRVSRATVYNRLRAVGAEVLDFAPVGKKGKKVIPMHAVLKIEQKRMKRLK